MRNDPVLAVATWRDTGYTNNGAESRYIYRLRVTGGLHKLTGNDRPYFSITADLDRRPATGGKYREESGGCLHDEIEERFPGRFSDLIALHLSDDQGAPMHAEANGWYWLAGALGGFGERYHGGSGTGRDGKSAEDCLATFARHCRIPLDEAREIRARVSTAANSQCYSDHNEDIRTKGSCDMCRDTASIPGPRDVWHGAVDGMRERWAREARECVERHGLKVYGDVARV